MRQIESQRSQRLNVEELVYFCRVARVPFDASLRRDFAVCGLALPIWIAAAAVLRRGCSADSARRALAREQRAHQQRHRDGAEDSAELGAQRHSCIESSNPEASNRGPAISRVSLSGEFYWWVISLKIICQSDELANQC